MRTGEAREANWFEERIKDKFEITIEIIGFEENDQKEAVFVGGESDGHKMVWRSKEIQNMRRPWQGSGS